MKPDDFFVVVGMIVTFSCIFASITSVINPRPPEKTCLCTV